MVVLTYFTSTEEMDQQIIPYVIYNETINREKEKIQDYFILHPALLYSFVGYNGTLKLANQLSSNKKCGCFYTLPWKTYYSHVNNLGKTTLSFSQQVEEYRYLSEIALGMVLDISQYMYYTSNNLEYCTIFNKKYYTNNFTNPKLFRLYIYSNFAKINRKYIYPTNSS